MTASGLAWTVAAAASVAVSLLALSSINAGTAAGPPQQLAPEGLANAGADGSTAASPDGEDDVTPGSNDATPAQPTPTPMPTQSPDRPSATVNSVQRLLSSSGGTVVARCVGASAYLVSWSPAQGYQVGHVLRGPSPEVGVTFRNATNRTWVEVEIHCVAGTPTLDDGGSHEEHGDR